MNLESIELLILDVDGVLTDGSVTMTAEGESSQTVHVHDGCAIKMWQRCGGKAAILSGRKNEHVAARAQDLGIEWVLTGIEDKSRGFAEILASAGCEASAVGYIGDDVPDLGPMTRCGFPVAVANAVPAVKRAAAYVTRRRGGHGAVAEAVEFLLRKKKQWSAAIAREL